MEEIVKLANEEFKRLVAPLANSGYKDKFVFLRPGVIEGHWHEDNTTYEITCPPQLQPSLLGLLNHCHLLEIKEPS